MRISHAPRVLERPLTAPLIAVGNVVKWIPVGRGPVRLEIEMPARSSALSVMPLLLPVFSLVVVLGFAVSRLTTELPLWVYPAVFVVITVVEFLLLGAYAPFATRETLEIDSMVVALRRGSTYLSAWDRSMFDDVQVAEPEKRYRLSGKVFLGGEPTLVWGFRYKDAMSCLGGAGAGINHDAASRVMDEIRTFLDANPCESDPKHRLGVTQVRAWSS